MEFISELLIKDGCDLAIKRKPLQGNTPQAAIIYKIYGAPEVEHRVKFT